MRKQLFIDFYSLSKIHVQGRAQEVEREGAQFKAVQVKSK